MAAAAHVGGEEEEERVLGDDVGERHAGEANEGDEACAWGGESEGSRRRAEGASRTGRAERGAARCTSGGASQQERIKRRLVSR